MKMDECLNGKQCSTVRDFFHFLIVLKHQSNGKRINTSKAMQWYRGSWYGDDIERVGSKCVFKGMVTA